ncbi:MAG TPA: cell wall hydrolase [Amaricoccus sp.]|nr:cell wall hydrolase [Amaricoccus sp.]
MRSSLQLPVIPAVMGLFCLVVLAALPARADTSDEAVQAMSRDNPALIRAAIADMFGTRPRSREAAEVPELQRKIDLAALDAMPTARGGEDQDCLAQAIYFESRGEPLDGQVAVAEVVLNRVDDRRFPKSVCGVTRQGAGSGRGCQFSYACDGRPDVMKNGEARVRSEKLAAVMLGGHPRTVTDGATYFHTRGVRPGWAGRMTRTVSIGHHYFYRAATRVASE